MDEIYMKELHQPRIWYKGVVLQQFMDVSIDDYQATLEEWAPVEKLIKVQWDPNQNIVS